MPHAYYALACRRRRQKGLRAGMRERAAGSMSHEPICDLPDAVTNPSAIYRTPPIQSWLQIWRRARREQIARQQHTSSTKTSATARVLSTLFAGQGWDLPSLCQVDVAAVHWWPSVRLTCIECGNSSDSTSHLFTTASTGKLRPGANAATAL